MQCFISEIKSLLLYSIQEDYDCVVTPYEKNLEFWRQLWRVLERSDLVIQIVDSRHPLQFRSQDLEKYVKEISTLKQNLVLINKADFLTLEQRKTWAEYFTKEGLNFAFFSAIAGEDSNEKNEEQTNINEVEKNKTDVLSSDQMVDLFRSFKRHQTENITVGFIGYPNVGKSSTINKLLCAKKVICFSQCFHILTFQFYS